MSYGTKAYKRAVSAPELKVRVVTEMPEDEVRQIDEWAVPLGFTSRTAAIRAILRRGLEALKNEAKAA